MLRNLLLTVVLVCLPSYSYSESITPYFGTTGNAASVGNTWSMDNVLPTPPGLDINGVFYKYTPQKETEADMKVHIGNENANGVGYLWRETDDWSGAQGGIEIRKVIGIANVPRELWGDGSIEVDGTGTITDASVVYTYRYEEGCASPLDNPTCDGYADAVLDLVPDTIITEIYNALEDENIDREETEVDNKEEEQEPENTEEESDIERALAINEETLEFGNNLLQDQMLQAMNNAIGMQTYFVKTIDGGVYNETVVLIDKTIKDNKNGARMGLASDLLHDKMVNLQYDRGE